MGNRAYMVFPEAKAAIYLHWNGGIESVVSFLDYANEQNVRSGDAQYGLARVVQIVGNYFGGTLSVGIQGYSGDWRKAFGHEDNGAYLIGSEGGKLAVVDWSAIGDKAELPLRIARARRHAYNVNGELLAELREKNDHHFKPEKETQTA